MKKVIRVSESNLVKLIQKVLVEEKHINPKKLNEQESVGADVGTIVRELDKYNSDESAIVNIVKKYKDKASFKNFIDQYKTISGKDFGTDVYRAIEPYNDKTEWADLSNHLKSMGITLGHTTTNRGNSSAATLTGLDTPTEPLKPIADIVAQKRAEILSMMYSKVRDGIIVYPGSAWYGEKWSDYVKEYGVTSDELAKLKSQNAVTNNKSEQKKKAATPKPKVIRDYTKMLAEI